ncbi:MAG: DUF296 domain-containing protein [Candidatus Diapherotrites archaeon]|nr:DUF296 domain-containing protein [Candidatus Diapherotrites archaeon]
MAGVITMSLDDGEDICKCLDAFTKENDIKYGLIVSSNGGMRDFEVSSHGKIGSVTNHARDRRFKLETANGTVERKGKELIIKMNVLASAADGSILSGELVKGRADGFLEIGIRKIDLKKIIYS